jgi:hypothetical protein
MGVPRLMPADPHSPTSKLHSNLNRLLPSTVPETINTSSIIVTLTSLLLCRWSAVLAKNVTRLSPPRHATQPTRSAPAPRWAFRSSTHSASLETLERLPHSRWCPLRPTPNLAGSSPRLLLSTGHLIDIPKGLSLPDWEHHSTGVPSVRVNSKGRRSHR